MTLTQITTLLPPLQSAIAMQSWEDAQDIASEIARLCRLKHRANGIAPSWSGEHTLSPKEGQRTEAREQKLEGGKTASQEEIQPSAYGKRFAQEQAVPAPTPVAIQTEGFCTAVGPESGPCIRITLDTRYDEQSHEETWRNQVASQLNSILRMAGYHMRRLAQYNTACFDATADSPIIKSALSIVSRVAEFEQIKTL